MARHRSRAMDSTLLPNNRCTTNKVRLRLKRNQRKTEDA
ncbi:hypothetical protein AA0113_g1894 [Alternaria arborescens]|uniref:Uncharacterized protein n=1 Tax=Alternaria arborescens TaxID=156630 RepID=A0A4Q4SLL6_9PLEO|nr:hypothetical protein AA0111_g5048 [Alternaria arborescens]RYN33832.1 hypothetical protein AA0112_g5745 [Alternaria arborescens]RYO30995.1 hypothetical protein AA0111_g5048 [Alternaria arborescens]RYO71665.1 hypothetical protein AA0113_g1894 [Alternaria arborescens]